VRLGHLAFTRNTLDKKTISRAVKAFRHFREVMDRLGVESCRAVATSAAREARNRRLLLDRIRQKAGIELEVIESAEEARLVRAAVLHALRGRLSPRVILDLGGGSLEMNLMRGPALERDLALPLGVVRLMETYGIQDSINVDEEEEVRLHIQAVLREHLAHPPNLSHHIAVACGGNAEALADLAPGPRLRGFDTINLWLLRERLDQLLSLSVERRMKAFGVRRDRAEVMGLAAIVFTMVGRYLKLPSFVVPRVGVREGIVLDLVRAHFSGEPVQADDEQSEALRTAARWFGRRLECDVRHSEYVRRLGLALFDQLRPLHRMGPELRLVLEVGAILHDVGRFIDPQGHHKHGEYLVRNARIPELKGWRRDMVASLVRYHNGKSEPEPHHKPYSALDPERRRQTRLLAALLRLAEALDSDHKQAVERMEVAFERRQVEIRVSVKSSSSAVVNAAERRAELFEKEFRAELTLRRSLLKRKVA
jgi:exopolyphosphatase/guanosine-5'-triphosphate,3'-diphosphate pyrophosphatase